MKANNLGPFLLSGLIIGPILGSGIIILPPIVHESIGNYAIYAWLLIMLLGFMFAYIYGRLSVTYPGDSGAMDAIGKAFGPEFRNLASGFLILAVCVGPLAVLTIASDYLNLWFGLHQSWYTLILLIICYAIVSMNITSVGKLSLILSSLITVILVSGAISTLFFNHGEITLTASVDVSSFGHSILLLFWCLVGWEVIGNYSGEVKNPSRTIPKAVFMSALIIAVISLTIAAAFQWADRSSYPGSSPMLDLILYPLFGRFAVPIISLVTIALCLSTVLMVIGAVTRLISAQASHGVYPRMLSGRSKQGVPYAAMAALFAIHLTVWGLVNLKLLNLEQLLAIADAFFLCNALIGIVAAFRVFTDGFTRTISVILIICLITILAMAPKWVLVIIVFFTLFTCYHIFRNKKSIGSPEATL